MYNGWEIAQEIGEFKVGGWCIMFEVLCCYVEFEGYDEAE